MGTHSGVCILADTADKFKMWGKRALKQVLPLFQWGGYCPAFELKKRDHPYENRIRQQYY